MSRRKPPGRKGGSGGRREHAAPAKSPPAKSPLAKSPPAESPLPESPLAESPLTESTPPGMATEDAALWRRVAGATEPLRGRRAAKIPPPPTLPPAPPPVAAGEPKAAETGAGQAGDAPAGPPPPPLSPGAAQGVDQRTVQRLRRGQLPIDARLDLHGLILEDGLRTFSLFIQEAQESRARCVLVITGKGSRPSGAAAPNSLGQGATGVLRAALPGWINRPDLRPLVLAFCPARPKDGGAGAFYILLKRRR